MKRAKKSTTAKLGPGEYRPDVAFQRVKDLPRPKILKPKRNFTHQPCPRCGKQAFRDRVFVRKLHDIGDLSSGRPHEIHVTYSQHYCSVCRVTGRIVWRCKAGINGGPLM